MDNNIIIKKVTTLNENEEILICFKEKHLILTLPNNKSKGISVNSISTIGKNTIEINGTKFLDCNYIYYLEKRPIEDERIKHKINSWLKGEINVKKRE